MIKIGITGSLASGKTTASKILSSRRGPLFSADKEVRKLFESQELEVSRLKRVRIGPIFLPSTLREGACINLTESQIRELQNYGK